MMVPETALKMTAGAASYMARSDDGASLLLELDVRKIRQMAW
jgi:hypothetical protein